MVKDWNELLQEEKQKPYFKVLQRFIDKEYVTHTIYPIKENIFNALKLTPLDKVKVVILAQDPYINFNQAHGLAFSVLCQELPPSLKNIYKEISDDIGIDMPEHNGNLSHWAEQGVLLLNTVLTVRAEESNSHAKQGWEFFTDRIIKELGESDKPMVFLLWGSPAQKKEKLITGKNHLILKTVHPSPLSAYRGFFGCKHFSQTNSFLKENRLSEIDWKIE